MSECYHRPGSRSAPLAIFLIGVVVCCAGYANAQVVNPADKQDRSTPSPAAPEKRDAHPAGQTTGSAVLRGFVQDEQGGAIRDAVVEVTCGAVQEHTRTDESGRFRVGGLPEGRCTVKAEAPLFAPQGAPAMAGRVGAVTLTLAIREIATRVVVTPARGPSERTFSVPESVSVVSRDEIDGRPYTLLPQVLREEPGILLQQTTTAQTSPIIRGFTGPSNVYLVDGVRLNNASWRSGPSQYFGWIDGGIVDRLEIVRGPSGVQYGSDALGGTINVITAAPSFTSGSARVGGDVQFGFGTADSGATGQADLTVAGTRAAFRFGGSTRRVQDLRTGGGIDSHSAVTRFLGLPSTTIDTRLPDTGYRQSGGYVSGQVKLSGTALLSTTFVHEDQSGVSRYDRIWGGDGLYRSGFDPQRLDFGVVRYRQHAVAGFDEVSAGFSVNRQGDGRFEQTRPTAVLDQQRAATTAIGYQVDTQRRVGSRQLLTIGTELYDETTAASREQINPLTNVTTPNRPDIPEGTTYANLGVFAEDTAQLSSRISVRGGLRYGRFAFATVADPAFAVTADEVVMNAVTFNAGAVVSVTPNLNATFNVGRGFRAANAADLGGIGLTGGGGFEVMPSRAAALGGFVGSTVAAGAVSTGEAVPALGPEVLYSFEPGVKFHSSRVSASASAYDLEYLDTIQRRAIVFNTDVVGTTIAGYQIARQDATGLAYIAQDIRPVATRVNVDHARLLGFDADGSVQIARRWSARAFMSMTDGHLLGTGEYLRRMPPPLGGARLRWSADRVWVEAAASFAAAQTRYNSGDVTDARIGAARTRPSIASYFNGRAVDLGLAKNGILQATGETLPQVQNRLLGTATTGTLFEETPGFFVLGLRAGIRLSPLFDVVLIGENLTDRNYRLYGSGSDAPGANLQVRVRYRSR